MLIFRVLTSCKNREASLSCGLRLVLQKSNNEITFWKDDLDVKTPTVQLYTHVETRQNFFLRVQVYTRMSLHV